MTSVKGANMQWQEAVGESINPKWHGAPWCAYEKCEAYDGERCARTGFRPGAIWDAQSKKP